MHGSVTTLAITKVGESELIPLKEMLKRVVVTKTKFRLTENQTFMFSIFVTLGPLPETQVKKKSLFRLNTSIVKKMGSMTLAVAEFRSTMTQQAGMPKPFINLLPHGVSGLDIQIPMQLACLQD